MDIILETKDVRYSYERSEGGEAFAVDGVSLQFEKGSFTVVVGHNGSGKSTLAKLLNGLFLPTEGKVLVEGRDTCDEKLTLDIRRSAGLVLQNPDNQIVSNIVEEDVAFGPENLGVPPLEIRKRVNDALERVGMSEFAQAAPHMLSGGQKQRIAIAGILAMRPRIMILDEPTAMLDPVGRREVMDTVKKLNKEEGITVIHITHYMEEAVDAHRVIVMDGGKVVDDGKPRDIFAKVEQMHAAGLDVPPMAELNHLLKKAGMELPDRVMTVEEMEAALCR